jgi:hypothetical protein
MTDQELRDHLGPVWDFLEEHGMLDAAKERIATLLAGFVSIEKLGGPWPGDPERAFQRGVIEEFLAGLTIFGWSEQADESVFLAAFYGSNQGPHGVERTIRDPQFRPDGQFTWEAIGHEMGRELRRRVLATVEPDPPAPDLVSARSLGGRRLSPMRMDPPGTLAVGDRLVRIAADVCHKFDPRYDRDGRRVGTVVASDDPHGFTWLIEFPDYPDRLYLVESAPIVGLIDTSGTDDFIPPGEPITAEAPNHLTEAVEWEILRRAARALTPGPNIVLPPSVDPDAST